MKNNYHRLYTIDELQKIIKQLKNELKFCYTEETREIQTNSIKIYENYLELNLKEREER